MVMTVYLVAQSEAPAIFCPSWCDRTDDHLSELDDWEGRAVHTGYWPAPTSKGPLVNIGRTLLADGTADNDPDSALTVIIDGTDYTIEQAEEFAQILADAIATARAEETRTR